VTHMVLYCKRRFMNELEACMLKCDLKWCDPLAAQRRLHLSPALPAAIGSRQRVVATRSKGAATPLEY
jgi:hypothetical protein